MKHKLRPGEWVRSTYAAPWVGVVLERVDPGRGMAEVIRVEVRIDDTVTRWSAARSSCAASGD